MNQLNIVVITLFSVSFAQQNDVDLSGVTIKERVQLRLPIGLYHEVSRTTSNYHEEMPGMLNIGCQIVMSGRINIDQVTLLRQPKGEFVVNLFDGRIKNLRADFPLSMTVHFVKSTIKEVIFTSKSRDVSKHILDPIPIPPAWSLKNGLFEVMITIQEKDYNVALNGIQVGLIPHSMSFRTVGFLHYRGPKERNGVVEFSNCRFFQSN